MANPLYRNKTYTMKEIPEDVYKAILMAQADKKVHCKCQFSMESIIYILIRRATKMPIVELLTKLQMAVDKLEAAGDIETASELFALRNKIDALKG